MPSASRSTTPVSIDLEIVEGRYAELDDHTDREETYVEGDAYVAGPGHRPLIVAGTTTVEFIRTADLQPVMEVIGRSIDAMTEIRS